MRGIGPARVGGSDMFCDKAGLGAGVGAGEGSAWIGGLGGWGEV